MPKAFPECACCFTKFAYRKGRSMIRCREGHTFCTRCIQQYVLSFIEDHKSEFHCMDLSGCTSPYPRGMIKRYIGERKMNLIETILRQKNIMDVNENPESCSFCGFACVADGDSDILSCQNKACGAISCRKCKKRDHRPRTCTDPTNGRHFVEEQMTAAAIRWCPKCKKAIFRVNGCYQMRCTCKTTFCFRCGMQYSYSVGHIIPANPPVTEANQATCPAGMFIDDIDARVANAECEAIKKAQQEYPDIKSKELQVTIRRR